MDACPSVQDDFLQTPVKDKTAANVFLVNGIRLSGQLSRFDQFTVLLESGSAVQLVFKHAISTVMPVNGAGPARVPTETPMSHDKSNMRTRRRISLHSTVRHQAGPVQRKWPLWWSGTGEPWV